MYSESFIHQLKKTNISEDAEKTSHRVKTLWQSATKYQRNEILRQSGLGRATIQRVYTAGIISAKLVVALAQVMDVNPYYLIGQSDEQGMMEEEALKTLLTDLKYDKLMEQHQSRPRRKPIRKMNQELTSFVEEQPPVVETVEIDPQQQELMDNLTEEDIILLFRSIQLKAKVGGHYADVANQIRKLLIS